MRDSNTDSRSQCGRRFAIHWFDRMGAMTQFDQSSDQLSIETPELVAIQMPIAGIGSRFIALLVDYLIWVQASLSWVIRHLLGPA